MHTKIIRLALLAVIAALSAGCATTDPYTDSSIPWNAPQSWEGSPGIPGFDGR